MMRKLLLVFFIFILPHKNFAQQVICPASQGLNVLVEHQILNSPLHSAIKPFLNIDLDQTIAIYGSHDTIKSERNNFKNYYKKSAVNIGKLGFLVRPIYDLSAGFDFKSSRTLVSTVGGIIVDADFKRKIGIEIRIAGGTSILPNYLDSIASFSGVMPGWGDRAYSNGNSSYSFQHISGNLIWRPSKIFNLQVGRDKHFWGDGYRSLFLSDVSAAIPYIKQTTSIWKLQYVSLFAWMQDYTQANGFASGFRNKFGTFHYLSYNATKWFNVGVFESVIWQGTDSNRQRGFDVNYLNPVIFFRPVEYSLGSSDNSMLGLSLKFRLNKNNQIYSQFLLDEFYLKEILAQNGWWANKQAYQLGFKCFNFAKVNNLYLQTELNIVRPFTYSHGSTQQNYSNAGNSLAHPLGANFMELIGIISYTHSRFFVSGKLVGARFGLDLNGANYGQNINRSYTSRDHEYSNFLFQGLKTNLFYAELKMAFTLKTTFPLRLELVAGARNQTNVLSTNSGSYFQFGFSLPIWNTYRDY